jgi:hypothetical protein
MITHASDRPDAPPYAMIVTDSTGSLLADPELIVLDMTDIVDQVSPARVGVDSSALLDWILNQALLAS